MSVRAVPLRTVAVAAAVLAVLASTGWLAVRWGSGDPGTAVAAASAPATSPAPATSSSPATSIAEPPAPPAPSPVGDRVTEQEWAGVVLELYGTRARAFATASAELLGAVWAPDSAQRAPDEAHARSLADAGERLRGFAPSVADVAVLSRSPERVELQLVDGWSAYEVVAADRPDGPPLRTAPARPVAPVRVVLVRGAEGWRMESAQRLG